MEVDRQGIALPVETYTRRLCVAHERSRLDTEHGMSVDREEYLARLVDSDFIPIWVSSKQKFVVRLEMVTVRSLLERNPEVGSEEAVASTTEALRRFVAGEHMRVDVWLRSVPPLLREFGFIDFIPRYAEMIEAMRSLGLYVRLYTHGWLDAEEIRRQHMWAERTGDIMCRQRRATALHGDTEYVLGGIKTTFRRWGPALDPRPTFNRLNPHRDYPYCSVAAWSQPPASRGFSPAEADSWAAYMSGLHGELQEARLARTRLSQIREWGGPVKAEFGRRCRQVRQIEEIIGRLATGTREDFLEYERTLRRTSGQGD